MTPPTGYRERWTAGAETLRSLNCSGEPRHVTVGLLHAVSGDGLIAGRSVCLAPVTLLDPLACSWPDNPYDAEGPLCWICLALTA
jgi:hypothetical protein